MNEESVSAVISAISGIAGVVVGSALAILKDWVSHLFKQREHGRYAAIRIIVILNEYVQKCVSVVGDDGTCEGRPAGRTEQGEEYCSPQVVCPEPPAFPGDLDWRSIDFKLMYRILSLSSTAQDTDRYINAASEHSFPPDYDEVFSARQNGYAHLGLEAINIIKGLRKEFDLPEQPRKFWEWGWDSEKFLKDKLDQLERHRNQRAEATAKMFAEFTVSEGAKSDR